MKKVKLMLLSAVLSGILSGCDRKDDSNKYTQTALTPALASTYKQQLQKLEEAEIKPYLPTAPDSLTKEAMDVVAESTKAIGYLNSNDLKSADTAVEHAIGKAEKIVAVKPDLGLVPLDLKVNINDLVADLPALEDLQKQVKDLSDKGYLQDVRRLMDGISSEVTITTSNLPLATYPDALKAAAKLIVDKKGPEAALVLNSALNTIVIETRSIPLPIIRATANIKEADRLLAANNRKDDKDIVALLNNADYEIHFAEALGYGKKDKEFADLYSAVKNLKDEVQKKDRSGNAGGLFKALEDKLNAFKTRISQKTDHK
jgi:hypothetical protein